MDRILIQQNPHWQGQKYVGLFKRNALTSLLKKQTLKEIQIILGIRRAGKSSLFKLLINELMVQIPPAQIFYLNLDDPYFSEIWQDAKFLYQLIETAEKITSQKITHLFLDEIQNIKGWEKFIKSVYDSELLKKIFITGSNSSLMSEDYSNLLSGRFIVEYIYPLSFKEISEQNQIKNNLDLISKKTTVLKIIEDQMFYGSFPEILKINEPELKLEVLKNYYETILLKDCFSRYPIRETRLLKELSFYLTSNITSLYSYNSLAQAVSSNENTIKDFLAILEKSFIFYELKSFSRSIKITNKSKKKTYCLDNGLIEAVSFKLSENKGKLFENLVFSELLKQKNTNLFFYNEEKECDFILKQGLDFLAIQVAYELTPENRQREISGLNSALEKYQIPKGYIITFNQNEIVSTKIEIVPFWQFFY